ncbi:MAG: hypothetical protein IJO32_02070 [Bacilli bacterium]|nr:hypothetical protein [Bacilli bacterium]
MDEREYQILEKLVHEGYVIKAERHQGNGANRYTFTMKPAKDQNIANKYKFDVYHAYEAAIDKMDKLVLTQKLMKKENRIKKFKIATSAAVITTLIAGYSVVMYKRNSYRDSVMKEVNSRVEQLESELPPNMDVSFSTRQSIYNDVINERKENLQIVDTAIEESKKNNNEEVEKLKEERDKLIKSYYNDYSEENAKSK